MDICRANKSLQVMDYRTIEAFNKSIALGVVTGCAGFPDAKDGAQRLEQPSFELRALVRVEATWRSKARHPTMNKCQSDSLSSNGRQRNGFSPASEVVDDDKDIPVTGWSHRKWTNDIQCDKLKTENQQPWTATEHGALDS